MPCRQETSLKIKSQRATGRLEWAGRATRVVSFLLMATVLVLPAAAQTRPPEIKEKERSDPAAGEVVIINPRNSATPAPDPYAPIKMRPLTDEEARAAEAKAERRGVKDPGKETAETVAKPSQRQAVTAAPALPPLPSRSRAVAPSAPPAPDDRVTRNDSGPTTRDRLRQFPQASGSIAAAPPQAEVPQSGAPETGAPETGGRETEDRTEPGADTDAPRGDRDEDAQRRAERTPNEGTGDEQSREERSREERAIAERRRRRLARQSGYEPYRARGERYRREGRERPWQLCRELAWRCEDGLEGACFRWRRTCS